MGHASEVLCEMEEPASTLPLMHTLKRRKFSTLVATLSLIVALPLKPCGANPVIQQRSELPTLPQLPPPTPRAQLCVPSRVIVLLEKFSVLPLKPPCWIRHMNVPLLPATAEAWKLLP